MSAERLREAADRLEALTKAASPPPWRGVVQSHAGGWIGLQDDYSALGNIFGHADGAYIAAMHPGVGKALAEWLRGMAVSAEGLDAVWQEVEGHGINWQYGEIGNALAVADAILGGAA